MEDPGKVIVAVVAIVAIATTIRSVIFAAATRLRDRGKESMPAIADARLSRLEQAVDAIAVEVERISEGQRFTTRLLSEQARERNIADHKLPAHTPT